MVELTRQNRKAGHLFAMKTITQTMRFRQAVIEYSDQHGVTKAAIRYRLNRQYIYRWRKRYDGTLQSLADRSHRPHSHPNQHTPGEIKLILDMRRRNPTPLIASIPLTISEINSPFASALTTISLCVLSTGALPSRSYSLSIMCNTSLTNPHPAYTARVSRNTKQERGRLKRLFRFSKLKSYLSEKRVPYGRYQKAPAAL